MANKKTKVPQKVWSAIAASFSIQDGESVGRKIVADEAQPTTADSAGDFCAYD